MNRFRLSAITDEACSYIRDISSKYDLSSMFVSFSGGKDSTVTSNLVIKALDTRNLCEEYRKFFVGLPMILRNADSEHNLGINKWRKI